jgi:hypothetical protein
MADDGYATFIDECSRERASLAALVESLESGTLGVGVPITLPKVNAAPTAMIASSRQTIADLDVLIAAYEAEKEA